ncbi:PPE family protein, partial [Mycobacterium talmoniae]
MTAPIWLASPPEVWSALLSSGPGPAPLLAAAGAWTSLSTEYAETADELTALLGSVQAGAWEGPTAESYLAAHAPYLAWLLQQSAESAARAAQHETVASAYTAAVAGMPTLAELGANHATHATLVGTNFFGINTIPIALNEADYVRMWIQAATVMSGYDGVATTTLSAAPDSTAAPTIMKADTTESSSSQPPTWFEDLQKYLEGLFPQPSYPDTGDFPLYQELLDFFDKIGFTDITDPFQGFFNWLNGAGASWLPPPGVPGSWLGWTGNPLSYLNPANIAYILSVPLDPGSFAAFTSMVIVDDMLAILYTAVFNPQALVLVVPLATVEMIGSTIGNTVQLLHYLIQQTVLVPVIAALAASSTLLAPPALLGGFGLAALAKLAPAAVAPVLPPAAPPPATPVVLTLPT